MKNDKKQQAHNLYFQTDLSQQQIADLLDVDRRTIHNWLKEGNWRQLKKLANHVPTKVAEQFYFMLANLNHDVLSREHQPFPMTYEAEEMRKLSVCIKNVKNRQTINESMESFTRLAEIISHKDPELAAKLRPHIQDYIKSRADFGFADCFSEEYNCKPGLGEMFDYEMLTQDDDGGDPTVEEPLPGNDNTPAPLVPVAG
jgi:predicted DNA-binding protein YlxM (UPF0122 family)